MIYLNKDDLRDFIDSFVQDIEFDYLGVHGVILLNAQDDIMLCYGDDDRQVRSIDAVMCEPMFHGKSLNEIAEQIELY